MKHQKIQTDVFFLSPDGEIVPVYEGRHINAIIKYPEVFGFTSRGLEKVFKKFDEDMGDEGRAREEIMINVISRGWIRVRFIPKYGQFILQVWKWTTKIKANIWEFLNALKTKAVSVSYPIPNPDIVIRDTTAGVLDSGELRDVMGRMFNESVHARPRIKMLHEFDGRLKL